MLNTDGTDVQAAYVPGDLEGICYADPSTNFVYVGTETPNRIYEYNFVTRQITRIFDLNSFMVSPQNNGLEALTFVPIAGHPEGGVFYAGHQQDGRIFIFNLPIKTSTMSNSVTFLGTMTPIPGLADISGLDYDRVNDVLYVVHDNADLLTAMRLDGTIIEQWYLPGVQQEGVAVKPPTCEIFIADDTGPFWRYGPFPPGDYDHDGVPNCDDQCPQTPPGLGVDSIGCACAQLDHDGDGVSDCEDRCPDTPAGVPVSSTGCGCDSADTDFDGIDDCADTCPNSPFAWPVDSAGCACNQLDTDHDGVKECWDLCPATPLGAVVDGNGCSCSQRDGDNDGVVDCIDICPATLPGRAADEFGCSCDQRDSDHDGVIDCADLCPNTAVGVPVNPATGCAIGGGPSHDGAPFHVSTPPRREG